MGRGCRCKKRLAFGMAAAFLENLQKIYKLPIFLLPNRFGYGNISFVRLFTRLSFGYKAYAKPGKRFSRSGGIGRRARFRSVWWQHLVGSTPIFCMGFQKRQADKRMQAGSVQTAKSVDKFLFDSYNRYVVAAKILAMTIVSRSGGIGRRARFRSVW